MSSSLGTLFRVTTFGESHGGGVGVVVDGCPPRLPLASEEIQRDLDRRRPGQSRLTTPRQEADRVEILSGVFEGRTLGSPDRAPGPERGRAARGLRRAEGRLSAFARRLHHRGEVRDPELAGWRARERARDGRARGRGRDRAEAPRERRLRSRCSRGSGASTASSRRSTRRASRSRRSRRTRCAAPIRRRLRAWKRRSTPRAGAATRSAAWSSAWRAACRPGSASRCSTSSRPTSRKGLLSLPASKGFEIGSGFAGTRMTGIEHNDPFVPGPDGRPRTASNRSGGDPGRHLERRAHRAARGVQADRHDPPRAGHGGPRGQGRAPRSRRPPRSLRAAARGADGRGDGLPRARRPLAAPARGRLAAALTRAIRSRVP